MPDRLKRVIFHMGLNKAGSSSLQDLFSHNFKEHSANQIFYPKPHRAFGNAGAFSQAVRELDKKTAMAELDNLLCQARPEETVLLSTEFMYHQFVKPKQRDIIFSCFSDYGIVDLRVILVFRNVFDHAVSAYCHRCGVHAMPAFESWIVETPPTTSSFRSGVTCYELWAEMRLLLATMEDDRFNIDYFPYSSKMEREWSEFLGVELTPPPSRTVNVSVTPSEAEILRRLRDRNGFSMNALRQRFKSIERNLKVESFAQLNHYHALIKQQLERNAEMVNQAERAFGFVISKPPSTLETVTVPSVKFNALQLDAIVDLMATPPHITKKDKIKKMIPKPLQLFARKVYRILRSWL